MGYLQNTREIRVSRTNMEPLDSRLARHRMSKKVLRTQRLFQEIKGTVSSAGDSPAAPAMPEVGTCEGPIAKVIYIDADDIDFVIGVTPMADGFEVR